MHQILVNRLGGLSLPRKSVVRLTDRPYMTGVVRWCWVNFQCRGVLLIWSRVGQGPTALTVSSGGCCLDIFTLVYYFSSLSPSLWETARYRLKYCLQGPLSLKQPTNQPYMTLDVYRGRQTTVQQQQHNLV